MYPWKHRRPSTAELARYEVESVTYPAETTARYAVTIPKDAMVGEEINEAALVDSDGDVVAIKTMYSKKKDEDVSYTSSLMMNFDLEVTAHGRRVLHSPGKSGV